MMLQKKNNTEQTFTYLQLYIDNQNPQKTYHFADNTSIM